MNIRSLLLALPFIAFSCNTKISEEDNIPTSKTELLTNLADEEDTTKTQAITETKSESVVVNEENSTNGQITYQKPVLIARGSEPGWYAEFFKDHLRLLVDYGKDSVFVESDFTSVAQVKNYKTSFTKAISGKGISKTIALTVNIDEKTCVEEAGGDKQDRTITLKFNNKTYKGCAFTP